MVMNVFRLDCVEALSQGEIQTGSGTALSRGETQTGSGTETESGRA